MKKLVYTTLTLVFFAGCLHAQTSKKEAKELKKQAQYEQITRLVDERQFEFIGRKANTQKGRQVDLTTNPNFVRIHGENAHGDMPYFGRAFSDGYSTSGGGINFDGPMDNLDIQKNDKKRRITMKFNVRGSDDAYKCTINISGMESASLYVNSNKKQGITFTGIIKPLEEE